MNWHAWTDCKEFAEGLDLVLYRTSGKKDVPGTDLEWSRLALKMIADTADRNPTKRERSDERTPVMEVNRRRELSENCVRVAVGVA